MHNAEKGLLFLNPPHRHNLHRKLGTHVFCCAPTNVPRKYQKIGDFIVTSHSLGSGSFATVHLAMDRKKCRQVACKIIKAKSGKEISVLMKEVDILTAVQHVCVFDVSIVLR